MVQFNIIVIMGKVYTFAMLIKITFTNVYNLLLLFELPLLKSI